MLVAEDGMNTRSRIANGYENRSTAIKQIVAPGTAILIAAFAVAQCCSAAAQTAPKITGFLVDGVKSNRAAVGATLTIQGSGFGATQGFSIATLEGIALAGAGVKPIKWSDTSIEAAIPQTVVSGPVIVDVLEQGHSVSSNPKYLNVRVEITGVSPDSAPVGTGVTVEGNGFGTRDGKVTFNGVEAVAGGWGDSSINATVPAGATAGPIRVTVAGHVSNGWYFTPTP